MVPAGMLPHFPPSAAGAGVLPCPSLAHDLLKKALPKNLIKLLSWCIFIWFHVSEQLKRRGWCSPFAYMASHDDVGCADRSPRSRGLSHRAGHAAHSVAQMSLIPLTPCSHFPAPQPCNGVLFANTPASPLCILRLVEQLLMQSPLYPPETLYPEETVAPGELGARTQTVQEGEKTAYLFFVHCKHSSIIGEDPLCSSAPHRNTNVSWAQSTVKKDSLENDKR